MMIMNFAAIEQEDRPSEEKKTVAFTNHLDSVQSCYSHVRLSGLTASRA